MTTVSGFAAPEGAIFDGANVWITDYTAGTLLKLDSAGSTLRTVGVRAGPEQPVFDGANIWVPNSLDNTVTVVQASSGVIAATLAGNGLSTPLQASFDGERVLVTDYGSNSISLWKAADLTPLGPFAIGSPSVAYGACSDGIDFWITLSGSDQLARF